MNKKILSCLAVLLFAISCRAENNQWEWAKKLPMAYCEAKAASGKDGSVYITGYFQDSLKIGNITLYSKGYSDIFVSKLDSSGQCLWAKRAGGICDDRAQAIAVDDSGNCYISGFHDPNADFGLLNIPATDFRALFLARMDKNGNWQWIQQSESNLAGEVTTMTVNNRGSVWVGGIFTNQLKFGSTVLSDLYCTYEILMLKYTTAGNFSWAKQSTHHFDKNMIKRYGPQQTVRSMAADSDGNLYLTGGQGGRLYFDSLYSPQSSSAPGGILIAKIDSEGAAAWVKTAGTDADGFGQWFDIGQSVIIDQNGNCIVAGQTGSNRNDFSVAATFDSLTFNTTGYADGFIAKINSSGEYLWVRQISGAAHEFVTSAICDRQNNVYISGEFGAWNINYNLSTLQDSSATFGSTVLQPVQRLDAFVSKLSASGDFLWTKQAGGLGNEYTYSLMLDNRNNCCLFGAFDKQLVLPCIELNTTELWNGFLAKLNTQTGISESENQLKQTSLNECYPNPFNNSALITYQLSADEDVKLTIFNAQGQVVKELLNQKQSSGFHTVKFNANGLNSGVYFYKLQTAPQSITKRAVLLK